MSVESSHPRPTLASLLSLAWPIALARATQSVIGFCDALMVAPLGEAALAATTMGALNTFAGIILPVGAVFIVQSFAAQLRGRGDMAAVSRYAWYGLAIALAAGGLAAALIPAVPTLIAGLGLAPDVQALMTGYVTIRVLSILPAVGTEALGNWFGGLGSTRPALVAGLVSMVANVLGNYLLIEGRGGPPALGAEGAHGPAFARAGGPRSDLAVLRGASAERSPPRQPRHASPASASFRASPNGANFSSSPLCPVHQLRRRISVRRRLPLSTS
jgi:Na+-driven multidrug efflux pump